MSQVPSAASLPEPEEIGVGELIVHVESPSVYFRSQVPIAVRDSGMRLVDRVRSNETLTLSPGLYQISAVLEDGQAHEKVTRIEEGTKTTLVLGASSPSPSAVVGKQESSLPSTAPRPTYSQRTEEIDEEARSEVAPHVGVELLEVRGAGVVRATRTLWILQADPDIDAVPSAVLRLGDAVHHISLPTSPESWSGPMTCALRVDETLDGAQAGAWIAPQRIVANALQNMVGAGQLGHAAAMADEATGLLRGKYDDPTGAALGALVLHRAGRMATYASWLENLARDFEWLPDGKILLASHLASERSELDRALELALSAAEQRILYTESYSILLDLLRRWPDRDQRSEFAPVLGALSERAPDTDWESVCVNQVDPE